MAENIIIEISADAQKLTPVIDQLVKLGQVSAKDAEEFKKIAVESAKMATETKKAAVEAKVLSDNLPGGKANPKPAQETEKTSTAFKSLKTQLSEAKTEAARLAQEMGEFSPQAIEAAKRAALLDDRMKDLNKTLQSLNPEAKFRSITNIGIGISGAFTAAQGAMALFGEESEDVQKAILKVQGALALTQGLNSVLQLKDAFRDLRIVLGITAVAGQGTAASIKAIGLALLSNPITLLVAALGSLAAAFIFLDEKTEEATEAQEDFNKVAEESARLIEALNSNFQQFSGNQVIAKLTSGMKESVFSSNELKAALQDLETQLESLSERTAATFDLTGKGNVFEEQKKQITDLIKSIETELDRRKPKVKVEVRGDDIEEAVSKAIEPFETNPPEIPVTIQTRDIDAALAEIRKQLAAEDFAEFERNFQQALSGLDEQLQEFALSILEIFQNTNQQNIDILEESKEARLDAFDEELERLEELNNNKIISDGLYTQKQKELARQREATEKELNRKIAEEKKKAFLADRNVALIKVAINTAEGITKIISQMGVLAPPFIAIAAALGALQAATILSQPIPKFLKKGVIGLQGAGTETSDSIPAMLSRGESVMTAQETRKFEPTLLAIRKNRISPELLNAFSVNHNFGAIEANIDTGKLTRSSRKLIPHQADAIGRSVAKHLGDSYYYSPLRN